MLYLYYFLLGAAAAAILLLVGAAVAIVCSSSLKLRRLFAAAAGRIFTDEEVRWTIPARKYRRGEEEPASDCPVCLSVLADGEEIRQLPQCKHFFHSCCIDRWLALHFNCPVCRRGILPLSPSLV
ncbi:RING-H2 finger protein ATL54 [Apostasia shenzhenica]|uniref:RING-H2 finger protein ATL54 n=1 Tax=Apostasia shenzhenica TaxID=1088818 RepID=A0A2I0B996_9ASPA|nr:RING-H2 finger protein ATL54 [Apostasia shenzhenica]